MSGSLNKVTLIGNLGKDPEIRSTQGGKEIASFTIATSEQWTDKLTDEKKEKTEWHRIAVFSPGLVNVVKNYLKKGMRVYVEGSLQTRKWTDASNAERYTTEVVLQSFNSTLIMLDRAGQGGGQSFGASAPSSSSQGSSQSSSQMSSPFDLNRSNSTTGSETSRSAEHSMALEDLGDEVPF